MRGKMITITPQGLSTVQEFNAPPSLATIQSALGGHLQLIPYFEVYEGERCIAYVDEEGKLKGSMVNPAASRLWFKQCPEMRGHDILVGNIVILMGDDAFMRAM